MQSTSQPQPKNYNSVQTQTNPQQLGFGPVPAIKPKPTIAQLRDAMNAFNIRGTCRLVAFELLSYWQPGGQVFPKVQTLADGMGLSVRVVRRHVARLDRLGLWVRIAREGYTNLYELRLPGPSVRVTLPPSERTQASGGGERSVRGGGNVASAISDKLEVTKEVQAPRAREVCKICGHSWPKEFGPECYRCLQAGPSADDRRQARFDASKAKFLARTKATPDEGMEKFIQKTGGRQGRTEGRSEVIDAARLARIRADRETAGARVRGKL